MSMFSFGIPDNLAVVPVFVNAGAAILPALVGAVASFAALLFKPKDLWAACKKRPWVPAAVLLLLGAVTMSILWWPTAIARIVRKSPTNGSELTSYQWDWEKVALDLIQKEKLGGIPTVPSTSAPVPSDSAMYYRGGAQRTGYLGGKSPDFLQLLWSFSEQHVMYLSSPVIHNGRVYGASCLLDPPGSYGSLFCLDAETGKKIWQTDLKNPRDENSPFKGIFSSPALTADGKYLVVGQGLHTDFDSELICVDTATGAVQWLVKTPLHLESSPAISGDLVVIGAGAVEQGDDHKPKGDPLGKGNPGFVLAVQISTGKVLWKYQVNDPESSPAIVDGIVYIGSGLNGQAILALRSESDEELNAKGLNRVLWQYKTPYPAFGAATVVDNLLLMGCGKGDFVFASKDPAGVVLAVDRNTGKSVWQVDVPDAILATIAVVDGKAIVPLRNGEVMALDLKLQGKTLWKQRISGNAAIMAGAAVTESRAYVLSQDGYLGVLDIADGKLVSRTYVNSSEKPGEMGLSVSAPVLLDGRVYLGSETGGLRCYIGKEAR